MTPGIYSIRRAQPEDIAALPAIELTAARLLTGLAPESVLTETTSVLRFADAAENGRLWVAAIGNTPVGFALVEMLADDLPHLEELDGTLLTGAAAWGRPSSVRSANGRPSPGSVCLA